MLMLLREDVRRTLAVLGASLVLLTLSVAAIAGEEQAVLSGAPVGTTAESNPTIQVTDPSASVYRHSVNGAPYSPPVPIDTPLSLRATVIIEGQEFVAGTRELSEFINRRTDEFTTAPFIDRIAVQDVQSQLQIAYLLNGLRAAVRRDNTLNIRGAGIHNLRVNLIEANATPGADELQSFIVDGGELVARETSQGIKVFSVRLPLAASSITVTPRGVDTQTAITVNGSNVSSGSAITIEDPLYDGAEIVLSAAGPSGARTDYLLTIERTGDLSEGTSHQGHYLRAADPASAYLSIENEGGAIVSADITFNSKLGLTTEELIEEISGMPPEFPGESIARKTWRFIRANRYHAEPLTTAAWFTSPSVFFNSAGFGHCLEAAHLFYHLMTAMGHTARVWALGGHVVSEVLVDGRWELWDADLEVYYFNEDGLVASVSELIANPELITNPINPVITEPTGFPWQIGYSQLVAGIYASTADNSIRSINPASMSGAPFVVDIPPQGTLEFPRLFEAAPSALYATKIPSYTNARIVVPPGFSGSIAASLIVHSIGYSSAPTVHIITGTGDTWSGTPVAASWVFDGEAPIATGSQPSGAYNLDEPVTLLASEPATIYYTLDGTTPTTASLSYTDPFQLPPGGSVLFFAVDAVGNQGPISSYGPLVQSVTLDSSAADGVVSFVAQALGGVGSYEYMYIVATPGGAWSYRRAYSPDPTWSWDTHSEAPGTYVVQVWARNVGQFATPFGAVTGKSIVIDGSPVTAVQLSASLPSPQRVGTAVTMTAVATGPTGSYEYQFVMRNPSGEWSTPRPYSSDANWTWNTSGAELGTYVIQVWARNAGASNAYDTTASFGFTVLPSPITQVVMTSSAPSPHVAGTPVTFHAEATGTSGNYEFQFVSRTPDGVWAVVQPYSAEANWTLPAAAGTGTHLVQVWARNAGTSVQYDVWSGMNFEIVPALVPPVTAVTVTTSHASPQLSGAQVTLTADAVGTSGNYEYQFMMRHPTGAWVVAQAYGASAVWTWNTQGLISGRYMLQVWARNVGSNSSFEAYADLPFHLLSPPVQSVALTTSTPSPQMRGAQITLSANATGTSGSYEYQFILRNPSGQWSIVQPYGPSASWTWNSDGSSVGAYMLQVWARNTGSLSAYEAYADMPFSIVSPPVTGVTVTTSLPSPQIAGSQVLVTAQTTGGGGDIQYQFLLRNPSGVWSIVQGYGSADGWSWDTASGPPGNYFVQVWARSAGSTSTYEAFIGRAFTVSAPEDEP